MKENDWIAATLNNPTFDVGDFQNILDLNLDNTLLLSKELYLKYKQIRENPRFLDEQGNFSEKKFSDFYDNASKSFQIFSNENIIDTYEYSMWDVMRPKDAKIRDYNFNMFVAPNPEHIKVGAEGFNKITLSDLSARELALNSKIYDTSKGEWLDKSTNDISLFSNPIEYFKSLLGDPLVYAIYDENEYDDKGKLIHLKGEWKINDDGEYYTETLGGRSLIGRQVVSSLDYLTSENTAFNKYDFFDSDDLLKSIGGSIMKNVVAVLPMLTPLKGWYSGLLVLRELGKSLPMLYGIIQGLRDKETVDNQLLNTIAAYGEKFTSSTSDYAQSNTFAFENFANLMSDVAIQWGEQKFIAESFAKLTGGGKKYLLNATEKALNKYGEEARKNLEKAFKGEKSFQEVGALIGTTNPTKITEDLLLTGKWRETPLGKAALREFLPKAEKLVEKRTKIGQDLSLAYMAIISNTDVYESVLEKGATPFEAACITLGSTAGMFAVDKFAGLGEIFFDDTALQAALRSVAKKAAKDLNLSGTANTTTRKGILGLIDKGTNLGKKIANDFSDGLQDHTLGFFGKAFGEGLEEVSEELVTDLSKLLGEVAGRLGYFSQDDYGAWDNAFDRYAMSFLGGAAGGGLFYGIDAVNNKRDTKEFTNDLNYLLRQGKKNEILKEYEKLYKRGILGDKNLSYKKNEDGTYLTAENEKESQAYQNYQLLINLTELLDYILNDNGLNFDDDALFDKLVQGEYRAIALSDFLRDRKDETKEISYITRWQEDFQNLANKITEVSSKIENEYSKTDETKRDDAFKKRIEALEKEKEALLKQKEDMLGAKSLEYVEKLLFAMDTLLSGLFMSLTFNQYVRNNLGKAVADLSDAELEEMRKRFKAYKETIKDDLDVAFKLYKEMEGKVQDNIKSLGNVDWNAFAKQLKNLGLLDPFTRVTWDTQMPGESDKDFKDRSTQREGEDPKAFEARKAKRQLDLKNYVLSNLDSWISEISKTLMTTTVFRSLQSKIGVLKKELEDVIVKSFAIPNTTLLRDIWNELKKNGADNPTECLDNIKKLIRKSIEDLFFKEHSADVDKLYTTLDTKAVIIETYNALISQLTSAGTLNPEQLLLLDTITQLRDKLVKADSITLLKDIYSFYKVLQTVNLNPFTSAALTNPEEFILNFLKSPDTFSEWFTEEEANSILKTFNDFDLVSKVVPKIENDTDVESLTEVERANLALYDTTIKELDKVIEYTDEYINGLVEQEADNLYNAIEHQLIAPHVNEAGETTLSLMELLSNDPKLKALRDLEVAQFVNNPVIPILNVISQTLSGKSVNLEDFLKEIYNLYSTGQTARDFILNDEQIKILKKFQKDLQIIKALVHAASVTTSDAHPIGHNKSLNQFIENHKDVFKNHNPLPEMDEDVANTIIKELNEYDNEIENWINLSTRNQSDNVKKHLEFDLKFIAARFDFFKINRDKFKISPTLDLLDGWDETEPKTLENLVKLELLVYKNYNKAIKDGHTLEEILLVMLEGDATNPAMFKIDEIQKQLPTKMDNTIVYASLTDYDKFVYLVSLFAVDNQKFYNNLESFLKTYPKIAPLSLQEYCARITFAQQNNQALINNALDFIDSKFNVKLPILYDTTVITGIGGSGKTAAVSKQTALEGNNIWYSGPTNNLIDNLKKMFPKGTGLTILDILKKAVGDTIATLLTSPYTKTGKDWSNKATGTVYTKTTGLDGLATVTINSTVKINKITNPPKLIIIDEATHLDTATLLVISKFCTLNDISLVLIGDGHQNGVSYDTLMRNLNRENVLAWRTPELYITLRNNNYLKDWNLLQCLSIIDLFNRAGDSSEVAQILAQVVRDFAKFGLKYHKGKELYGDYITSDLSDDLIAKLDDSNTKIAYIGSDMNVYNRLKAKKKVELINPKEVLGREFDYVIVDIPWDLEYKNVLNDLSLDIYYFLQNLYTMISRSRKGTVLLDKGLSKIISNFESANPGTNSTIDAAIPKFRAIRQQQLESIKKILSEESKKETPKEPKKKPKEPETKKVVEVPEEKESVPEEKTEEPEEKPEITTETPPAETKEESEESEEEPEAEEIKTIVENSEKREERLLLPPHIPENPTIEDAELEETESLLSEITNSIEDFPVRVYGNVHYSGIDTSGEVWENNTEVYRDLGIFIHPGESITDPKIKDEYVGYLLDLKCLFYYGLDYIDRIPASLRKAAFPTGFQLRNALTNTTFHIVAENVDNNSRLIGFTDLENDDTRATYEVDGEKKIFKLIARFKVKDKVYEISLGALADPDTWEANQSQIIDALRKRYGDDNEEINTYITNLPNIISKYKENLENLGRSDAKEIQINKPDFSSMTTLVDRDPFRLEEINSSRSKWDNNTRYAVTSDIYVITSNEVEGHGEIFSSDLLGKSVIYVSSNRLLKPSELPKLYEQLKIAQKEAMEKGTKQEGTADVRMIILDNVGVSFYSLYLNAYKDLYTTKMASGKYYMLPFEAGPMGLRMYLAAWNFRANLTKLLQLVEESSLNHLTDAELEALCKLDREQFVRIRKSVYDELKASGLIEDNVFLTQKEWEESPLPAKDKRRYNINENGYRLRLKADNPELAEKLQILWDFNDSLATSCAQFRLGYEQKHGAYIRKLNNIRKGILYDNPDNAFGIYINIGMARHYKLILDALFTEALDKLIPPISKYPETYINWKSEEVGLQKGWYKNLKKDSKISFKVRNADGVETIEYLDTKDLDVLAYIPTFFINFAKFSAIRREEPDVFDTEAAEESDFSYKIAYTDAEGNRTDFNWLNIVKLKDIVPTSSDESTIAPGIELITRSIPEEETVVMDKRLDNLFNLMFHGVVAMKESNNFERSNLFDVLAPFKHGFLHDIVWKKDTGEKHINAPVASSRKFHRTNVVPAFPLATVTFAPYVETTSKPKEKTAPKVDELTTIKQQTIQTLQTYGITLSIKDAKKIKSIDDLVETVNLLVTDSMNGHITSLADASGLLNMPYEAYIEDNQVKVRVLTEHPKFEGLKIVNVVTNLDHYEATAENGDVFNVYMNDTELIIDKQVLTVSSSKDAAVNRGTIEKALQDIWPIIQEEAAGLEINTILDNYFSKNDEIAESDLNRIINEIISLLEPDESDDAYELARIASTDKLQDIIKKLNDSRPTCDI